MPREMQSLFDQPFSLSTPKKTGKKKRGASWWDEDPLEDELDNEPEEENLFEKTFDTVINFFTGEAAGNKDSEVKDKLFGKENGKMSAAEMLEVLSGIEDDPSSPFKKLAEKVKDGSAEKMTAKSLEDFVEDARTEILKEIKEELDRRKELIAKGKDPDDETARRFDRKFAIKMNIMKKVMGESEFDDLCDDIEGLGMYIDPAGLNGLSFWEIQKKNLSATLTLLEQEKSGQSKGFFQMLNGLSAFLCKKRESEKEGEEEEPAPEEKTDLASKIKEFVLKEVSPANKNPDMVAVKAAMFGLKQLIEPEAFELFIDTLNTMPGRHLTFDKDDFASLPEAKKPDRDLENEMEGPVLRPANPWEL
ncbi:MAG: hypothetical protein IKS18_09415 [Lachnospiraceae bacterium]|nr:hypothetical protein [Lachnospiraceae bacterium]